MRILLDNRETNLAADSVGAALAQASAVAEQAGRLIVEVSVDGISWTEEDLGRADLAARSAGEIHCATVHPAELLRDTFAHAADAVLNAEAMQRNAAQLLQGNRSREAYDHLLQALAVWGSVQTAVSRGLALGVLAREELAKSGLDLDGAVQALDTQLRRLRDAMVSRDETGIADCLLYEFPETSRRFAAMLATLARAADGAAAKPAEPTTTSTR